MNENSGIYTVGISDSDNRVEVAVDKNKYDQYTKQFQTAYGDMVCVKIGTAAVAKPEKRNYLPILCAAVLFVLVAASFFLYKKRRKRTES